MAEPPAKRRRKGGINQRIAALKREDALDNPGSCTSIPSELADSFLKKWAWGQLSPQDVQEYSAKACRDFRAMQIEPPPDLDFFSNMGTKGQYKHLGQYSGGKILWVLGNLSLVTIVLSKEPLLTLCVGSNLTHQEQDAPRDFAESQPVLQVAKAIFWLDQFQATLQQNLAGHASSTHHLQFSLSSLSGSMAENHSTK